MRREGRNTKLQANFTHERYSFYSVSYKGGRKVTAGIYRRDIFRYSNLYKKRTIYILGINALTGLYCNPCFS